MIESNGDYLRDEIKLIVESDESGMSVTYSDLDLEDAFHLIVFLIGKVSGGTGQDYNDVVEDLKEIDDEGM